MKHPNLFQPNLIGFHPKYGAQFVSFRKQLKDLVLWLKASRKMVESGPTFIIVLIHSQKSGLVSGKMSPCLNA